MHFLTFLYSNSLILNANHVQLSAETSVSNAVAKSLSINLYPMKAIKVYSIPFSRSMIQLVYYAEGM